MKKLTVSIIISLISILSSYAQVDSTRIELFRMANEDGKITRAEKKMINEILREKDHYYLRKTLPKSLDPAHYIQTGLEQGYKMILFRLQSRIIEDMDKSGRVLIDGKP